MAQIDNLNESRLREIFDRLAAIEHGSGMNSSAIGRGGIRVHSGGGITIENGGLTVSGSATISGLLEASGTINMSGTFTATGTVRLSGSTDIWGPLIVTGDTDLDGITTISGNTSVTGEFTVTGPTDLNGETTIAGDTTVTGDFTVEGPMKTSGNLEVAGTMDIKGAATLNNDLTVAAGKKITLGGLTLENTGTGGGTVNFPNGSVSSSTAFGILIASAVAVEIGAPSLKLSGLPTTSGVTPNLYMDGSGNIKRITP